MSEPQLVTSSAPSPLTIERRDAPYSVTLVLGGEIDLASAPALERALFEIERSSPRRIVLDLAALEFVDSTGIHLLLDAHERAEAARYLFVVTHVPRHVQRLFELTGITAQLSVQ